MGEFDDGTFWRGLDDEVEFFLHPLRLSPGLVAGLALQAENTKPQQNKDSSRCSFRVQLVSSKETAKMLIPANG